MKIETYEIEEIKGSEASDMAADATAIELIQKLKLTGQTKLVNNKTATRSAFRTMTLLEKNVFSVLFPERNKVQDFSTEIVPVRVLEVLDRAMQDERFVRFEVWHSRTRRDDPVLVGISGELKRESWGEYVSGETLYLLARWGDALAPFSKMVTLAKEAWMANRRQKLGEVVRKAKGQLESLNDDAAVLFSEAVSSELPYEP